MYENIYVSLASHAGNPLAYIKAGPASSDACHIIRDEAMVSVTGAFTEESVRRRGIATTLLNYCLQLVRLSGRQRCAVDFEPMNAVAARFWIRHFRSIRYTVLRTVDGSLRHNEAQQSD